MLQTQQMPDPLQWEGFRRRPSIRFWQGHYRRRMKYFMPAPFAAICSGLMSVFVQNLSLVDRNQRQTKNTIYG